MTQRDGLHWQTCRRWWTVASVVAAVMTVMGFASVAWDWREARSMEKRLAGARTVASADSLLMARMFSSEKRREAFMGALAAVMFAGFGCFSVIMARRAGRRLLWASGKCVRCGYDLRGLPEPRCPECGTAFKPKDYPDLSAPRPERRSE